MTGVGLRGVRRFRSSSSLSGVLVQVLQRPQLCQQRHQPIPVRVYQRRIQVSIRRGIQLRRL